MLFNLKEIVTMCRNVYFDFIMRRAAKLCENSPFMFVEVVDIGGSEYLRSEDGELWALKKVQKAKMTKVKISCADCKWKLPAEWPNHCEHTPDHPVSDGCDKFIKREG